MSYRLIENAFRYADLCEYGRYFSRFYVPETFVSRMESEKNVKITSETLTIRRISKNGLVYRKPGFWSFISFHKVRGEEPLADFVQF